MTGASDYASLAAMNTEPLIPVTVLTGFLGSGKTTILSRILRDPAFEDTAVIVNEFGEVGLIICWSNQVRKALSICPVAASAVPSAET